MTGSVTSPVTSPVTGPQRPRRRGIWIAVAVLSSLVIIVPLLAATAAWAFRHEQDTPVSYRRPITALRVQAPGAEVTVSAGRAGVVRITRYLTWRLGPPPRVRTAWAGRTLTVTAAGCSRTFLISCNVQLAIEVPPGVALRARTGGGVLTATALSGPLHVQAPSGVINLNWVSGPVWARAGNGVISSYGLTSPQVDTAVGGGSLNLQFAQPPRWVKAAATSGVVSVSVPRGTRYRITGGAADGVWNVQPALVSATSPRLITAGTVSGSVNVGYSASLPPSFIRPSPRLSPARVARSGP